VRTLVISDLHLGQQGGISVLERPGPLQVLLENLARYDRLVLLGDIVELQELHGSHTFPIAEPILRAISGALRPGAEIVLVPGNHDHGLIRDWSRARGAALEREAVVPHAASPLLAQLADWLGGERVQVRYPGVWLTDQVWATHGHYLNYYLRPISSVGVLARGHRRTPAEPRLPGDYESIPRSPAKPHMRDGLPPQRWVDHLAPPVLAPVTAQLLARQMRRHSLPALAQAAHALGVQSTWVVFGHVHRLGPLAGDEPGPWLGVDGRQQLLNTGSWRYEPAIGHHLHPPHPYWPGGAVVIEDDGIPRAVGLLDDLTEADFR
jgi:UDP-2,3-diacylglucosamine pyrophosphatase LpxH